MRRSSPAVDLMLRTVHLLFITVSALLALFVAWWAFDRYRAGAAEGYLLAAAGGVAAAVGLGVYAIRFRRRSQYW